MTHLTREYVREFTVATEWTPMYDVESFRRFYRTVIPRHGDVLTRIILPIRASIEWLKIHTGINVLVEYDDLVPCERAGYYEIDLCVPLYGIKKEVAIYLTWAISPTSNTCLKWSINLYFAELESKAKKVDSEMVAADHLKAYIDDFATGISK